MQETPIMEVEARSEIKKGKNKKLRENGFIPGIISGKGMESIPVAVKKDEFRKCLNKFGRNAIIKLNSSDGNEYNVMVKGFQTSPLHYDIIHIDFQKVSLSEEIKAQVPIKITGQELLEAKRLILNRQLDAVLVTGLPQDIPDDIEVDVSNLTPGSTIKLSDLTLPKGLTLSSGSDQLLLSVNDARVQESEEPEEPEA
ncbi:50S ribosomal protein L25 [Anaerocolumna aminovalerica]|jgi:large subunit ribosomal protein L25|uniref:Large ribosomal subunit protein bL25 n=1 Tax=Anaerocolumna aminovalerica TaxID=1527 RepID=A0A1I5IG46_9FIRM|nr:50S ribosomal protein L25 [Anaerocolumna aminovalerica]MDU6265710.1 50S ribosomal protein L25 [Anaerocolumna aminovalerica]SFO59527.1 large subunit ribosomal protein L25 [Anaerocolumna aminovalerica]